ncbi:hypothetical protein FH972_021346 [Carpinus fangiana]|uniref:Uncharacterized protein n=1 Tax=Carpinus fangiana TaxID=176857 RepID=A0A5N6KP34_9ROSI|nr:hypothetical protein FH972_021346 [Carpinus fangiana]
MAVEKLRVSMLLQFYQMPTTHPVFHRLNPPDSPTPSAKRLPREQDLSRGRAGSSWSLLAQLVQI